MQAHNTCMYVWCTVSNKKLMSTPACLPLPVVVIHPYPYQWHSRTRRLWVLVYIYIAMNGHRMLTYLKHIVWWLHNRREVKHYAGVPYKRYRLERKNGIVLEAFQPWHSERFACCALTIQYIICSTVGRSIASIYIYKTSARKCQLRIDTHMYTHTKYKSYTTRPH